MAVTDNLDAARAALLMINPAPYNAEAPPEALAGEITPTELHYVRSNFPVPAHDGTLEIGGAVEQPDDPDPRRPARHAGDRAGVTLECAGNGRLEMRPLPTGEPWGDYAVSTARWTGVLLHEVLEQARPAADGVDVRFEGADHGAYHLKPVLADTDKDDLSFVRALPLAHAVDPAAEILIAYEMNGEPLGPDHGAPFRMIVPHWYAVASVKWLKRIDVLTEPYAGEFQTGHYIYEWADRPHEPVALCASAPGSPIPPRRGHRRRHVHGARQSLVRDRTRHPRRRQPHRRRRLAPGAARAAQGPYQWQDWSFEWNADRRGKTHSSRAGHGRRRQRPTRRTALEPPRLREQRHRGPLRRRPLNARSDKWSAASKASEKAHEPFDGTILCGGAGPP